MTRKEAISLIISKPNTKIRHRYFSEGEFVYTNDNGALKDEDGNYLPFDEFFDIRQGSYWENDWSVIE